MLDVWEVKNREEKVVIVLGLLMVPLGIVLLLLRAYVEGAIATGGGIFLVIVMIDLLLKLKRIERRHQAGGRQ